jgi:glycosidase
MTRTLLCTLAAGLLTLPALLPAAAAPVQPAAAPSRYDERERDWRNGAIVYQVIVDRYVPAAALEAKRGLYPPPKVLRRWDETPLPGPLLPGYQVGSHELDFWGGDLQSLSTRLDYIRQLGADALYLTPIHLAWTNHKYDALDYQKVSPEYGTREDFKQLAAAAHARGLKVVLDGVFNHMGRNAPIFQDAFNNPSSPWRDWFAIGPQYAGGARVWTGFQNHPELNLENPQVRDHLYGSPQSVVRSYLRDGADGWRLDTAYELGPRFLAELTQAAHAEKPGSLVVGEIVNYPGEWLKSMDAVMNFGLRQIILGATQGRIAPAAAARMAGQLIQDAGIEPMLKSWTLLDNHDLQRIATELPDVAQRRLAQTLQFTLPGSPNVYYGSELGMVGGTDPRNRGPMRWDLATPDNPELVFVQRLIALRQQHRALKIGDFRLIEAQQLFAFERHTDRPLDACLIVANPADHPVRETLMVADAWLMDDTPLVDLLGPPGAAAVSKLEGGFVKLELAPHSAMVLQPVERALGGYSRYKRVP